MGFWCRANNKYANDAVNVYVIPLNSDFNIAAQNIINKLFDDVVLISSDIFVMDDGKTTAYSSVFSAVSQNIKQSMKYIYCYGANNLDKTIMVIAHTGDETRNSALIKEIAHTLWLR